MVLIPRKTKYKKNQKGILPNKMPSKNNDIKFGTFGLKTIEFGILTSNQIESARRTILKRIKKKGKLWSCIFTHLPKTQKPVEVRMGKGKGSVSTWIAKVKPGIILYEIEGISYKNAYEIFKLCSQKLPIKCKIVSG